VLEAVEREGEVGMTNDEEELTAQLAKAGR
jgi:hypothetical protein